MRLFLVALVIIIGANIGVTAINSFSEMQDKRLQQLCKYDPSISPECQP